MHSTLTASAKLVSLCNFEVREARWRKAPVLSNRSVPAAQRPHVRQMVLLNARTIFHRCSHPRAGTAPPARHASALRRGGGRRARPPRAREECTRIMCVGSRSTMKKMQGCILKLWEDLCDVPGSQPNAIIPCSIAPRCAQAPQRCVLVTCVMLEVKWYTALRAICALGSSRLLVMRLSTRTCTGSLPALKTTGKCQSSSMAFA